MCVYGTIYNVGAVYPIESECDLFVSIILCVCVGGEELYLLPCVCVLVL